MENTTEQTNSTMCVNNAVTEITTIISQHLTKVFDQVASEKNDIYQNLKILNQLSFVIKLRNENQDLKQRLNAISTKYESCLEELIMIKSQTKVTMEITELDSICSIPSRAEIESTVKNTPCNSLWDLHGSDDEIESDDSDAQMLSSGLKFINKLDSESSLKIEELREDPKNKDASAEEIKTAVNQWKLFYKDNILMNCNKSEEDTINDIMDSAAGLKGWGESYEDEDEDEEDDEEDEEADEEEVDEEEVDEEVDDEDEEADEEEADEEEVDEEDDGEEEVDEDEEEEKEEADDKNVAFAKTVLLAQEAGEYATIDTASEEDNEEEETVDKVDKDEEENAKSEDEEEVEVEEFKFENKTYYTDDAQNGNLFECLEDGEIGDIVGNLENGSVFFS